MIPDSIAITFFENYAAQSKREATHTISSLAELISTTNASAKDKLPWLKLCRFGNTKTEKGSLRNDANMIACSGIEGDYDGEFVSIDEAVEKLDKAGIHAVVYSSPSHTDEKPRWRVICPFSRNLPPAERGHMLGRVNGLLGGILADESFSLSQSYYYGSVNGNPAHRVEVVDGMQCIDQADELDERWIGRSKTKANGADGNDHLHNGPVDEDALIAEIITGKSYHLSCTRLLGRWAQQGVPFLDAQKRLLKIFDDVFPPDRDTRWLKRRKDVPRIVRDIYGKEAAQEDARGQHPDQSWIIDSVILSGTTWLARDIPEPDFLLGELLSTTARVELIGPTGLGKTNFLLALAMAAADGRDFLHWRGCEKPRRVLFLDGEMSRRLAKKRLIDAARRNSNMPATLFYLNREDFSDLQPLNTEAGQKFIDAIIEVLDSVDLLILDNVQSLLSGDMKDEEPWQQTLPWVRSLTQRNIGQIWVHHTGHDETHGYGSKTREWQLDTVGLLERAERPECNIAFRLAFTKARERTPDNRSDFEPAVITLINDAWTSEPGGRQGGAKQTATDRALELLKDAITREGIIPPANEHIPPDTLCVTEGLWRRYCKAGCLSEGEDDPPKKAEADRKAFQRAARKLIGHRVGKWDLWVWII